MNEQFEPELAPASSTELVALAAVTGSSAVFSPVASAFLDERGRLELTGMLGGVMMFTGSILVNESARQLQDLANRGQPEPDVVRGTVVD